jgi:hypothetical protein
MSIFSTIGRVTSSLESLVVRSCDVTETALDGVEHLVRAGVVICKYAEDSAIIITSEAESNYTEAERAFLPRNTEQDTAEKDTTVTKSLAPPVVTSSSVAPLEQSA